ncbi:Box C/D snoRNA accumulation [Sporothrix curviconia]|uniref:Box C/D snoRNA accumulation n=1 Tax=Sporothrix curviconia TaxID=1260050 RepID=A0ABP0B834_9PEZI
METASADPLLTTLCSVCRTNPPRYKCPRCNLPYCSVPCNRRHRARAGCSGIRDVTVFVPRSRLCTAAGIDRDYNFLQGIDVARASAVKHVVDERRVLRANDVQARVLGEEEEEQEQEKDPDDQKNKRRWQKGPKGQKGQKGAKRESGPALVRHWQGEELVFSPARRALGQGGGNEKAAGHGGHGGTASPFSSSPSSSSSFRVRGLCRRDGIELLGAPRGFVRQRENNTTVATTTTPTPGGGKVSEVHLHWQVEWLLYAHSEDVQGERSEEKKEGERSEDKKEEKKPRRILRRVLDNVPLYKAHAALPDADHRPTSALVDEVDEEAEVQRKQRQKQKQQQQQQQQQKQQQKHLRAAKKWPRAPSAPFANAFFFADSVQETETSVWRATTILDDDDAQAARGQFAFYLLRPRVSGVVHHAQAKELIPIDVADTLAMALPGRSVLEFPTIYVLPTASISDSSVVLPAGHVLGSTERRVVALPAIELTHEKKGRTGNGSLLKKRGQTGGDRDAHSAKKRKTGDGEDGDEDEGVDDADAEAAASAAAELESETSSSGEDSSEEESESEEDDGDDDDKEEGEEEEEEDDEEEERENGLKGLPALTPNGLGSGSLPADGKPKLVVYDSWSEGSDAE